MRATRRTTARPARALATALLASAVLVSGVIAAGAGRPAYASVTPNTQLVSVAVGGGPANASSDRPQISSNGRYVTFDSAATNLVPGVGNIKQRRVYRRDLLTQQTAMVSVANDGRYTNEWSSFSWPSADGHLVAFVSDDTALTPSPTVGRQVFVRDMTNHTTQLVSSNSAGQRAKGGASSRPMMSGTGRYVVFDSYAPNLSPAGGNGQEQVYLKDRVTGATTLVSATPSGALGDQRSYRGIVSDDGRYVSFASFASNLGTTTAPKIEAIYVRDMVARTTTRVSKYSDGRPAGGSRSSMTPSGSTIVFNTYNALVPRDTEKHSDVYAYNTATHTLRRVSQLSSGVGGADDSLRGYATADSSQIVFNSFASNLAPGDRNAYGDVMMSSSSSGAIRILSRSWSGGDANGASYRPVLDADGSVVAYLSQARNLVKGDTSTSWQVYAVSPATVAARAVPTRTSSTGRSLSWPTG